MIYVDNFAMKSKCRIWYHLMSDTEGEEIHEFAVRLGLKRQWFHTDHYDVTQSKRVQAIRLGAKPVSAAELVKMRKRRRWKKARCSCIEKPGDEYYCIVHGGSRNE